MKNKVNISTVHLGVVQSRVVHRPKPGVLGVKGEVSAEVLLQLPLVMAAPAAEAKAPCCGVIKTPPLLLLLPQAVPELFAVALAAAFGVPTTVAVSVPVWFG